MEKPTLKQIYTIGYAGRDPRDLKALCETLGAVVADIRMYPRSSMPAWGGGALQTLLGDKYLHIPELGNVNAQTDKPIQINDAPMGLVRVLKLARKHAVILLCGCAKYDQCHRYHAGLLFKPNLVRAGLPEAIELAWPVRDAPSGQTKCISLWQPHASLLGLGKLYETRSWKTNYRGPLIIHAGKSKNDMWLLEDLDYFEPLQRAGLVGTHENRYDIWCKLPLGAAIAVGTLTDCLPTGAWCRELSMPAREFGDFSLGRFAWKIENVRRFKTPIPMKGQQGLFDCGIDWRAAISIEVS